MPTQLHAAGANIAWVSFHSADNTPSGAAAGAGFTQAPDVEYTRLLRSAGHTVTRFVTTAAPNATLLNSFDLVIISRSVPSSHYQTADSTALWHGLTKPTVLMGGYILRANRLGYVTGDVIPDTVGAIRLMVNEPAHPIFTGVTLDAANLMINPYADRVTHNGVLQQGISVNSDAVVAGATVLATVGTDTDQTFGGTIIAEYPAQTVMGNATGDTTAAKRLVLLSGSREQGITSEGAGIFDLQTDGARVFLNAINYMAGLPVTEPPPLVTNLRPGDGTTQHFAPVGLSFRATSGTAAGIPATNISLVLNGTNLSSSLVITGTAQERNVSFTNLAANVEYTGIITVRDASGREVVLNFSFNTLPPVSLPVANAYPVSAAVSAAAGFRARIVQGLDSPILANSSDRAEAQLAGTLIDPLTLEPYVNQATPSTDNPDGSYNQQLINWSVESGLAAERGNFQDPQFTDQPIPGVAHNFNVATEVLTYLELAPGRYVMGVNSDDGFVAYSGVHHRDLFADDLGRFDGARGSADTLFQFEVTQAGLYPFRLVYYQGDGGGNLEWFTMDPLSGEKVLINDRANPKAVRAWRQISVPERPYIANVFPASGQGNVAANTNILVTVQNGGAQVEQGSVQLSLNGQNVPAQVTQAAGVTTIRYNPAPSLQGDTAYTVGLTYADNASNQRTITYNFTTRFVPEVLTNGANIVWVSFHNADNEPSAAAAGAGFTEAPDVEYTRLLQAAGHRVTRYLTTTTPDVAFLNTFDLVIVSRSNPSGNFQTPESTALWHSVTKPTIHLGGYALRASRLGLSTGETIPDSGGTIRLRVNAPAHPIFNGVVLDAATNTARAFARLVTYNGTVQRGISVNNNSIATGGTVLATVGTAGDAAFGGTVIAEFPTGTTMSNASADVSAGKQLIFLTGSREQGITGEAAGLYDLDGDGARLFLNAVRYMAGIQGPVPINPGIAAVRSANGDLVISWPEAGTTGFALQATSTLSTPNWQAVAGAPLASNGQLSMTIPTTGPARFFRLARP